MQNDLGWGALVAVVSAIIGGLFGWLSQRRKSEAEIEVVVIAQWEKLNGALVAENGRLVERCKRLEKAEEQCRNDLADVKERLAVLEGYEFGQGKARQDAANIVAAERLEAGKKDRGE